MRPEAWIVYEILKAWGAHPRLRVWRANVGVGWFANGQPARKGDPGAYPVRFGVKGQWDISGILDDGRRLEIECKRPGKKLRHEQETWGRMIRRFGGVTIPEATLEDVDRELGKLGLTR